MLYIGTIYLKIINYTLISFDIQVNLIVNVTLTYAASLRLIDSITIKHLQNLYIKAIVKLHKFHDIQWILSRATLHKECQPFWS